LNELLTILRHPKILGLTLGQWNEINNRKQKWCGTLIGWCLCISGLQNLFATELSNCKLDIVVLEEFKSINLSTEWAVDFICFF